MNNLPIRTSDFWECTFLRKWEINLQKHFEGNVPIWIVYAIEPDTKKIHFKRWSYGLVCLWISQVENHYQIPLTFSQIKCYNLENVAKEGLLSVFLVFRYSLKKKAVSNFQCFIMLFRFTILSRSSLLLIMHFKKIHSPYESLWWQTQSART